MPIEIAVPNRDPYYYDPGDDNLDSPGHAVLNLLSVPPLIEEPIKFPNVDEVLSNEALRLSQKVNFVS